MPRGQTIRFDRNKLLAEDLPTTATALATLVAASIVTPEAAWQMLNGVPLASVDNEPGEPPAALSPPPPPAASPPEPEIGRAHV